MENREYKTAEQGIQNRGTGNAKCRNREFDLDGNAADTEYWMKPPSRSHGSDPRRRLTVEERTGWDPPPQ
jgi:hypothetical protein